MPCSPTSRAPRRAGQRSWPTAGIKYLAVAHNYAGRSVPTLHRRSGDDAAVLLAGGRWQPGPDLDDRLRRSAWPTWRANHRRSRPRATRSPRTISPDYLAAISQRPFPYGRDAFGWAGTHTDSPFTKQPYAFDILHIRVQGVFADNAPPNLLIGEIARSGMTPGRTRACACRQTGRSSGGRGASTATSSQTYGGDWTDWWADGIGSGALPLGLNRRAQSDVRTAQTLHALANAISDSRGAAQRRNHGEGRHHLRQPGAVR